MRNIHFYILLLVLFSVNLFAQETLPLNETITISLEDTDKDYSKYGEVLNSRRTDKMSSSGSYSCEVGNDKIYGVGFNLSNAYGTEAYEFSIDRYSELEKGNIIIQGSWGSSYLASELIQLENGWTRMKGIVIVPKRVEGEQSIKFFTMNIDDLAYFDNLQIKRVDFNAKYNASLTPDTLKLTFSDSAYQKVIAIKDKALSIGALMSYNNDYVDAKLNINNVPYDIEIRLKGDWPDHLKGDRWSFRIKVKNDKFYHGMNTFSLQSPHTRGNIKEWFIHQFFDQEDVLTTNYDFVQVQVNGKNLGSYALEEHFVKQLVEFRKRREGPLLKYGDDHYFKGIIDSTNSDAFLVLETAPVLPFKKKKTKKNPVLNELAKTATTIVDKNRFSNDGIKFIDKERMAKFYAISDLTNNYHSSVWHNLRFYMNPVTQKIEPVIYDFFPDYPSFSLHLEADLFAEKGAFPLLNVNPSAGLFQRNMIDEEFYIIYQKTLYNYLKNNSLEAFYNKINTDLLKKEQFINEEYHYEFDFSPFKKRRQQLLSYFTPDNSEYGVFYTENNGQFSFTNTMKVAVDIDNKILFPNTSITLSKNMNSFNVIGSNKKYSIIKKNVKPFEVNSKTVVSKEQNPFNIVQAFKLTNGDLEVRNFCNTPIEIIGKGNEFVSNSISRGLILAPYTEFLQLQNYNGKIAGKGKYLHYKIIGEDSVRTTKIKKANGIGETTALEKVIKNGYEQLPLVKKGNDFILPKGNYEISNIQYISNANKLTIEAGTKITFLENGGFVSEIPVHFNGKQNDSIKISANHRENHGFHIIGAKNQSSMNFTAFHDLNTLHFEGWNLTGAVTFYESNVDIKNSSFLNNICEDGLNVIRSTFTMNNSTINHTAFDGLDADFCTATITNSQFLGIGNDGVDVSGAEITVDNCQFKNIGDKGISVGEQSTLKATNISVIEASIGLASKDLSVLTGNNIVIENADTAFAAYEKKGEFGSATINLTNTKATNFNLKIKEDKPNSISVQ